MIKFTAEIKFQMELELQSMHKTDFLIIVYKKNGEMDILLYYKNTDLYTLRKTLRRMQFDKKPHNIIARTPATKEIFDEQSEIINFVNEEGIEWVPS